MMSARYKAVTLLVLVSFLYSNVLWAVDLQYTYKLASRSGVPQVVELLKRSADVPPDGALIGKVVDENGQIITEYITGEIQGDYLFLWDTRTHDKKLIARIRCKREFVKEDMINELNRLLSESKLPIDSIERRYIEAIIEYSAGTKVKFYVLQEDVKNIYGFANEDIFCLYEPFLIIPAGFFHEAGESFFRSDVYRRFLQKELGHEIDWQRYSGKARVVVDGKERLIPAHTYLRGLGKKAREKERKPTDAERLLPKRKGLEDLLFGKENIAVSKMIVEQKRITQVLREFGEEKWVKELVQELKAYTGFFPGKDDKEIILFLEDVIKVESVSKLLDLCLNQLLRPNTERPNVDITVYEWFTEIEGLLAVLSRRIPFRRVKRILMPALRVVRKVVRSRGKEGNLERFRRDPFIMKALVRFFNRIEKAELHHHLDGAISPQLILKILCIFPEAREKFVREILKENEGSVNEVFSRVVGGPRTEEGWERLRGIAEDGFIEEFGGIAEYNKALKVIKRHLEYRPIEKGTVNIFEFLEKFMLTGIVLYCNPEALRIIAREATLETYKRDNTTLIEQKMHNLTFGYPLITVVQKVLMGFREAESAANGKLKTSLIMCVFKNPELVLGDKYKEVAAESQRDNRSIEEIKFSIWEDVSLMLQNDYADDLALLRRYLGQEKEELDNAITELWRMVNRKMPGLDNETREKEVKKRLLIFWEERKEGIRQVREIIRAKKQLALNYPDLARRLTGIDTVGSEVDYITWVHTYSLRLAKRYGFRITDHAGESWPEEDIWQALNRVKGAVETGVVERIGHATALGIHPEMLRETKKGGKFIYTLEELRDIDRLQKEILRTIVEKGIVIETNPSSNLLLLPKYITAYSKHPVHYFWKRLRKRLVVSSDDPHILHTIGLNGEYAKISLAYPNFKFGELLQIIRNSFSNSPKTSTEAISRPLWDGILPEGGDEDLSRFHPLSIINKVRDWDKRLPVLNYQKVGEYPKRLIELEKALTLCAAGWGKAVDASYGTLVTPAGMPAINLMVDSAIERKGLGSRSEIIVIEPPYGCTKNLFERWQRMGFLVHSVSADEIKKKLPGLINKRTAVIYLESVTNPNLMMPDIEYILKINRGRAAVLVDDTFATTEMAKSLELGVDMVMLGLTKGMTGTGNIISGAVTAKKEWLDLLARNRNGIPEDKEINRAIRGLRHLEVRFKAQSMNAKKVVRRIRRGRHVTSAVYPGNGHMIYHVFKGLRNAQDFIDLLAKFRTVINAVSLGQVRNLFERASGGTHVTVSNIDQERGRISPAGIRGSVGIEDIQDVLREIDAMLKIISVYGGYTMPREDLHDFQKVFMSEYLTKEEDKRKTRYLLPKWPILGAGFRELVSDLPDTEKDRLIAKYDTNKRFRKAVDIIIKATEITQYDPVTIAIHHRLLWCLLSGNHNAVIGSPDESTTTHKETDQHMQDTFYSILMGVKKGLPPIGNYTLYSRLGKPGICTFELLMTLLEAGIQKALDYEYIGTSFYTERMAYSAFLGQQAEIIMINEMMNVIQRKENVELRNTLLDIARRETGDHEVDSYIDAEYSNLTEAHLRGAGSREILPRLLEDVRLRDTVAYNRFQAEVRARIRKKDLEILIITPKDSVLYKEAKRIEQTDILKFRYIHPEDIDNLEEEVSRKTLLVYFDSLRMRDYDPAKIRDIVKGKNPRCMFGITDSFNLGYINPRAERDFDFITHVVYYEKSDKGAVVIARNDKPLLHVWNNPFWSRKNRGTATSEDNAFDIIWYILPYLRVFDERYDENVEAVIKLLSDLVIVRRIDKRHLEIKFKDSEDMERFLSIALKSKLIDVSIASQDEYFCISEWTSLRLKDSKSLILQIGVEETGDLVKEIKAIISKSRGAIGKGRPLAKINEIEVQDIDDAQREKVRRAIDEIKVKVAEAGLDTEEKRQAEEVISLLEAWPVYVFDAVVEGPEDYLLAFPRDEKIMIARDLLSFEGLPEILFHEGFTGKYGETDYEIHRSIYIGIQRRIFGKKNPLRNDLRWYINNRVYIDRINSEWNKPVRGAPPIDLVSKKLVKALLGIKKEIGGDCSIRLYQGPVGGIYRGGQPILLVKAGEMGVSAVTREKVNEADWEWLEEHLPRRRLEDFLKGPEPLEKIFLFKVVYNELSDRLGVNTGDSDEEGALSTAAFYIAKFGATSYMNSEKVLDVFFDKFGLDKGRLDKDTRIQLLIAIYAVANHDAVELLSIAIDTYQARFGLDLRQLDKSVRLQLIKSTYVLAMKNWISLEDIFDIYERRMGFDLKGLDKETLLQLLVATCEVAVNKACESLDSAIGIYEEGLGLDLKNLDHRIRLQLIIATYVVAIRHAGYMLWAVIDEADTNPKGLDVVDKLGFIRRSYNIATAKAVPDSISSFYRSGDLYNKLVRVINRKYPWLDLSIDGLKGIMGSVTMNDFVRVLRMDNGRIDKEDILIAEKTARTVDRFNFSGDVKFRLIQALIILIRQKKDAAREWISQQVGQYDTLRGRIKYDVDRYIFIDRECLPESQRYILEGVEWEKRKGLLEKMFPGYRFNIFKGALEDNMNMDNTIVLTNKAIEINSRLVLIQNTGEEGYFPIDGLIFLGVGLLNLSKDDKSGSPLVSTITRLYKDITGQNIDIPRFLENFRLDILLPPIGRFNTELESYAISLLEQAA